MGQLLAREAELGRSRDIFECRALWERLGDLGRGAARRTQTWELLPCPQQAAGELGYQRTVWTRGKVVLIWSK